MIFIETNHSCGQTTYVLYQWIINTVHYISSTSVAEGILHQLMNSWRIQNMKTGLICARRSFVLQLLLSREALRLLYCIFEIASWSFGIFTEYIERESLESFYTYHSSTIWISEDFQIAPSHPWTESKCGNVSWIVGYKGNEVLNDKDPSIFN